MHENNKTGITQQNHNTKYNVVHPQCRGYVHKLRFIPLSSKPQFICALSCRFLLPQNHSLSAHSAADSFFLWQPRTQQQASVHTAADLSYFLTKTLCAHSCRGRPRTQLGLVLSLPKTNLTSPYLSYIKNPNLYIFHKRLFILRSFTKTMVLKHGHPQNPKPWI